MSDETAPDWQQVMCDCDRWMGPRRAITAAARLVPDPAPEISEAAELFAIVLGVA